MPTPHRIAVIEDDHSQLNDLVEFLELKRFHVQGFDSAESFLETWPRTSFDVLILDIILPGSSGIEVAQHIRKHCDKVPGIIMLTALDANHDLALGLNTGADIYLSKRSSLDVIEAACHSVIRRLPTNPTAPKNDEGYAGIVALTQPSSTAWTLISQKWQLKSPDGHELPLTHSEVTLLKALFERPGYAITRDELLKNLDKKETLSSLRNLDNTVSRLKRKIQLTCETDFPLRTSYGRGYTFIGVCEIKIK